MGNDGVEGLCPNEDASYLGHATTTENHQNWVGHNSEVSCKKHTFCLCYILNRWLK